VRLYAHAIISAGTRIRRILRDEIYIIFPSIYIKTAALYRQFQCVYTLFMLLVTCNNTVLFIPILNYKNSTMSHGLV
jgi:hypothetical protein